MDKLFYRQISIQTETFDLALEEHNISIHSADAGALVLFKGMVREFDHDSAITHLYIQHYPQVTENEISRIVDEAAARWDISAVRVIHRVGELSAADAIVLVITCARHRKDAFAAAEFIMDYLKTQAPFWKREHFVDGSTKWVEAKHTDAQAAERWGKSSD